jgi:uncharacterized membrane protein
VTDGQKVAHLVGVAVAIVILVAMSLTWWQALLAAVPLGLLLGAAERRMIKRNWFSD